MSEARDAFGPLLARLQAEMAGTRADIRAVKAEQTALREYLSARAGETETLVERLFDRLNDRLDQTERSIEERLNRIEENTH
jgi:predicted nuclease with TOPRIM domain